MKLFKSYQSPRTLRTVPFNSQNGSDGESLAGSQIIQCTGGEIRSGSREEDGRKVDIVLSMENPWEIGDRVFTLIQVKTGESNGECVEGGFKLNAGVYKDINTQLNPITVVWIAPNDGRCFFAFIQPQTSRPDHKYGSHHIITPCFRFDLTRCVYSKLTRNKGGSGITLRTPKLDLKIHRARVRQAYQELKVNKPPKLKKTHLVDPDLGGVLSPVIGLVEFTKLGWRHMFRKSRKARYKSASMIVIPFLGQILDRVPSSHVINTSYESSKKWTIRSCEHLLKFEKVNIYNSDTLTTSRVVVHVRLLEEIIYPKNWKMRPMLTQEVKRRVVFKSCYYK